MGIKDPTMSPISEVTYEQYHQLILGLVSEQQSDLVPYVQESWTKMIYDDTNRKGYPIRTTVNDVITLAREVKRAEQSHVFTGYMMPGCDVVKISGGATSYQGWRPNMLIIAEDGMTLPRPKVLNFTVWGEHVSLWADKDLAPNKRRRITLPLFRKVSIIAEERDFDSAAGKKKGWTLLFFQALHDQTPIDPEILADQLLKCENAYSMDELNDTHLYGAVVLKDIKWRHAQGVDEWSDSTEKFEMRQVKGADGKTLMKLNQATNRMEPVYDRVPKREKSILGQPFIQDLIGSEEIQEGTPPTTWTMKLNIDTGKEDNLRPSIDFVNYRYGKPDLWIVGFNTILESAVLKGNIYDPDPEKNPFAVLNNSYRGTDLIAVVNFTKSSPYTAPRSNQKLTYMTFIPGLVMFRDPAALPPNDVHLPPLTEEVGVVSEQETAQVASPPTPAALPVSEEAGDEAIPTTGRPPLPDVKLEDIIDQIVRGTGLGAADVRQKIEEKKEELGFFVNDLAAAHIIAKDMGVTIGLPPVAPEPEPEQPPASREEELMGTSYPDLQKILRVYREQDYEVVLNQSKLGLINQIIDIEQGRTLPPKKVMEKHAEEAQVIEAPKKILSVQERKDKVAQAKAKLLAQKKPQLEPTTELDSEDQEWEIRRAEIKEILKDLVVDFPKSTFATLWGKNNDLEIFPEWVTIHHQEVIDGVIQGLLNEM